MSGDLTLMRPFWLLALFAVAGFGMWMWRRQVGLGDWTKAADPALLRAMAALGRVEEGTQRGPLIVGLSIVAIIVLALTGPAVERRGSLSFRNLDGVLFVVDLSDSVTAREDWPALMTLARFGISALGTRPGGLIVYSGDAYVATDLTQDHLQLGQTLSLLEPGMVPDPGSRPERALEVAATRLAEAQVLAGDVLVFTDGAGLGPDTLAVTDRIGAQGARVSFVSHDPSDAVLNAHADVTGGQVFGLRDVDGLRNWLSQEARTRLERQDYPLLFWNDLGRYVLWLAVLPCLLLFRRDVT